MAGLFFIMTSGFVASFKREKVAKFSVSSEEKAVSHEGESWLVSNVSASTPFFRELADDSGFKGCKVLASPEILGDIADMSGR